MISPTASSFHNMKNEAGVILLEVLITIIILAFGLLGLAGLQSKALTAELESYQRAQAVILAQDMSDRLQGRRKLATNYVLSSSGAPYVGVSGTFDCTSITNSEASGDCQAWDQLLKGAAEQGVSGAMIGARGCISESSGVYTITVTWQGTTSTTSPANDCARNTYKNSAGVTDDTWRRAVSIQFRIATLSS